jgi:hypothetical protein
MRKLSLLAILLLSGCAELVPISRHFPEMPETLLQECAELKSIEGQTVALSTLTKTIVENYALYYECSLKQKAMVEWYTEQKKIFEEANPD